MKLKILNKLHRPTLTAVSFCMLTLLIGQPAQAQIEVTLAQFTFEKSQPSATEAGGIWYSNINPEFGNGTASALHQNATTYSSPVGNGSRHSFNSANWQVGDCYQFACPTLGAYGISVAWDQICSSTGPDQFQFQYSTNGVNFNNFGGAYIVYASGAGSTGYWSSGTNNPLTHYTMDLSSISALSNAPTVFFRLVDGAPTNSSGANVGQFGTTRVDNFTVTGLISRSTGPTAITWPSPGPVTYGTALGSDQLNATANTPGTFSYSPTNGTVLPVGTNILTTIFTPFFSGNAATDTVSLLVSPEPLTVTANNVARTIGQTNPVLTGTLLGVVSADNVTASYNCSATATSPLGNYPITPVPIDEGLVNYIVAINNGTLSVVPSSVQEITIAEWTFQTSQPSSTNAGGIWLSNVFPEIGSGAASAFHQEATVYSSPVGNGSSNSLGSVNWQHGDVYRFQFSTTGSSEISAVWDQVSSYTGPARFQFQYSTDGSNFINVGGPYTVYANDALPGISVPGNPAGPSTNYWNKYAFNGATHYIENLSTIPDLNNKPMVWVQLVDASTASADGNSVGPDGADRVGNFTILGLNAVVQTSGAPLLSIASSGGTVTVYWQNVIGWTLQQNNNLSVPTGWETSSNATTANGTNYLSIMPVTGSWFFRLTNQ